MKILITGIIAAIFSSSAMAGNINEGVNPTTKVYEKWQKNAFLYPEASLKENANGVVLVSFKLDGNGEMTQAKVLEGISAELDKKALEIAKDMPTSHLTENEEGKTYILPVKFSIQ
jgi:TonB family protein